MRPGDPHQCQPQHCRYRLHEQNLATHRRGTEQTRDQYAKQKESLDGEALGAEHQAPNQSCREEAVVEPLVGRQHLGDFGLFLRQSEGASSLWGVPQEHFQHQEIAMQQGDQGDHDVRAGCQYRCHAVSPCKWDLVAVIATVARIPARIVDSVAQQRPTHVDFSALYRFGELARLDRALLRTDVEHGNRQRVGAYGDGGIAIARVAGESLRTG